MKKSKVNEDLFVQDYLSVVQIMVKLMDPTFLFGEVGRGSGKTTRMLAPRIDRVQNDMPGSELVLGAATYKSIIDNLLPGILDFFFKNYERGMYYEFGKRPPRHFQETALTESINNWNHTISFVNGSVVRFVSCDRPESMLGLNAAHLFVDEMIMIPEEKFVERIFPALRADRSVFGHSHYYMGITGFSSTPNFETDEDWWTKFEKDMSYPLMDRVIEMALALDIRIGQLLEAQAKMDTISEKKHQLFVDRWSERLNKRSDDPDERGLRVDQTAYLRASSFSNIKILGLDYIKNQIKNTKDPDKVNTSIFSIRKNKVKDMFFGKFGKEHLFEDGIIYPGIDRHSIDSEIEFTSKNLKYCKSDQPLIAGYDPGPFQSIIFAQEEKNKKTFRVLKNMWAYHPEQHVDLAEKIDTFFKNHKKKEIRLYYDRAGNQRDPEYRKWYPLMGTLRDSDANLLAAALKAKGWAVHLMSKGQETIYYEQHYRLLNILFGKTHGSKTNILIDRNECEALISSINHSPLKRDGRRLELDKSSEKLNFEDQILYSTQLSSAFMYLLWGMFNGILPASDRRKLTPQGAVTYTG